jgi:hypothetical protein
MPDAPSHFVPRAATTSSRRSSPASEMTARGNWPSVLRHGRPFSFLAKHLLAVLARATA